MLPMHLLKSGRFVVPQKMTPPIKDLLPRLTPILKNRQEKVQENCIDLVGRIADRCAVATRFGPSTRDPVV
jgi:hypothetical protein